jgi:hypothetical protein
MSNLVFAQYDSAGNQVFDPNSPTRPNYPSQASVAAATALVYAMVGRSVNDGVLNSTNTVSSATAAFTSADVGSLFSVYSSASATLFYSGTITAVLNSTTVTISGAAAPATGNNATFFIGKNVAPQLQLLLNAANNTNQLQSGVLELPGGVFMLGTGLIVPDGVTLRGQHAGGAYNIDASRTGTILVAATTTGGAAYPTTYVVQLGVNAAASNFMGAKLENCSVLGSAFVTNVVYHHGWESQLINNRIWGGVATGIFSDAKVGRILNNRVSQQTRGYCLDTADANDMLIQGNLFNGGGGTLGAPKAQVRIHSVAGGGDIRLYDNHMWQESPISVNTPAYNLLLEVSTATLMAGIQVRGNTFDNSYGHYVMIDVQGTGQLYAVTVVNNFFLVNDATFPNAVHDAVRLQVAVGALALGVSVNENTSVNLSGTNSFVNGFNPVLTGVSAGIGSHGNSWRNCNAIIPAGTLLSGGCSNNSRSNSANAVAYSSNRGRSIHLTFRMDLQIRRKHSM